MRLVDHPSLGSDKNALLIRVALSPPRLAGRSLIMSAVISLVMLLSALVAGENCSTPPIFVDFHSRAVDGGITFQYGLFTGIGSPTSQNLSQWPSFNNETTVGNMDYCGTSPFGDCLTQNHGFYSPDLSKT